MSNYFDRRNFLKLAGISALGATVCSLNAGASALGATVCSLNADASALGTDKCSLNAGAQVHMSERWFSTPKYKKRMIMLGDIQMEVVNLTEPLQLDTHGFPGDPIPVRTVFSTFEDGLYQHNIHLIGDHQFHPHGDAPNHFDAKRKEGFEYWSLEYVFNNACLIDLSCVEEVSESNGITFLTKITKEHLLAFSEQIDGNSALIIRTGYDKWLEANLPHIPEKIPYLSESAADFIASFEKLKVFGIDSLTVDKYGNNYAHVALRDKLIVESLVNLYLISDEHRQSFFLQTSPVVIVGATGGPVVAYAYLSVQEKE